MVSKDLHRCFVFQTQLLMYLLETLDELDVLFSVSPSLLDYQRNLRQLYIPRECLEKMYGQSVLLLQCLFRVPKFTHTLSDFGS